MMASTIFPNPIVGVAQDYSILYRFYRLVKIQSFLGLLDIPGLFIIDFLATISYYL